MAVRKGRKMSDKRDNFHIEAVNDCIVLSGPLTGSKQVRHKIESALKGVASGGARKVIIVSHHASVNPEGVVAWADAAEKYLADFQVYYSVSQLGTILQFDDAYTHRHSEYEFPLCAPHTCEDAGSSHRTHRAHSRGSHAYAGQ
jgi:hypothetical protein